MKIHILIINLNQRDYTDRCVDSVFKSNYDNFKIYVLDNGSEPHQEEIPKTHHYRSDKNLGFAEGNNFLLRIIIPRADPSDLVLFLNNDTEIDKELLSELSKEKSNVITTRMMQMDDRSKIDNLGLTMKLSGLALNRKSPNQKLFGPSGGCAAFTVKCLNEIHEKTLDYFDKDYFCYAEDTDLAWRAKLLGYKPSYLHAAICYHKGGATTGATFNKFTMYHTLRNTLYNLTKNATSSQLLLQSLSILGFQIALILRYLLTRKFFTLLKTYKDFFKHLPTLLKKRKVIQKAGRSKGTQAP